MSGGLQLNTVTERVGPLGQRERRLDSAHKNPGHIPQRGKRTDMLGWGVGSRWDSEGESIN